MERKERYEQVISLRSLGLKPKVIARRLGIPEGKRLCQYCVQAYTPCMNELSERILPLVRTFAMDAIRPNASKRMEMLEVSSNT